MDNSSKDIKVKRFNFIFIEDDVSNIEDIMRFCGIKESDLEQELIFHNEGDPFRINGQIDVYDLENHYLIKEQDRIIPIKQELFNVFFNYL